MALCSGQIRLFSASQILIVPALASALLHLLSKLLGLHQKTLSTVSVHIASAGTSTSLHLLALKNHKNSPKGHRSRAIINYEGILLAVTFHYRTPSK